MPFFANTWMLSKVWYIKPINECRFCNTIIAAPNNYKISFTKQLNIYYKAVVDTFRIELSSFQIGKKYVLVGATSK